MNFKCNDCGFTADIPEKRKSCPMCSSTDVVCEEENKKEDKSSAAVAGETEDSSKAPESSSVKEQGDSVSAEPDKKGTKSEKKPSVKRKKSITLTDSFFDKTKEEKEQEELKKVLQEVSGEKAVEEKIFPLKLVLGVAAALVVIVMAAVIVFSGGDESEFVADAVSDNSGDKQGIQKKEERKVVSVAEKEEESTAEDVEFVSGAETEQEFESEEEFVAAEDDGSSGIKKEEKKTAAEKTKKQLVEKREKKRVPVKKAKKRTVKRTPVKKTPARTSPKKRPERKRPSVNKIIQDGHKLLKEKNFPEALKKYRYAVRINPGNNKIYKFLGITYASMKDKKNACRYYRLYVRRAKGAADRSQVEDIISNYCE